MVTQTLSAKNPTVLLKILKIQLATAPSIPGNAAKSLTPNFLNRSAKLSNRRFIQSVAFLGLAGVDGVVGLKLPHPATAPFPPTAKATIVLINRPNAVKMLAMVIPCSLNRVLILSPEFYLREKF